MFFSKKESPALDTDQRELFENAQRRIKQKRGLFTHFIVFLVGAIGLVIISQLLMKGEVSAPLGVEWWIWILFIWLLLLIYHGFNVFVTKRLLGPEWEKRQYAKLIEAQKTRINSLQQQVGKEYTSPELKIVDVKQPKSITMIAAAGLQNELGKDGNLVWHLPDDFKRFKELTSGHHIIMGRKTFESFPKPLPNRTHIILTRDQNYKTPGGIVVHDMQTALAAASTDMNPFIIGGGEIYNLGLEVSNRIELTRVNGTFDVDTFFPQIDTNLWKLVQKTHHPADERHAYSFDFETWEKK